MDKKDDSLVTQEPYGYYRVNPLPSEEELNEFYRQKYYEQLRSKGGTSEAKLSIEGTERQEEIRWLQQTYYIDIADTFIENLKPEQRMLLDVGCGGGEFLEFMQNKGWNGIGIEPSEEAFKRAKQKGLQVYKLTIEDFVSKGLAKEERFDAITLVHFLEHVLNPQKVVKDCRKLLEPSGILFIRVPNDFNRFQIFAERKVKKGKWWVGIPEHINYFSFQSLEKLLQLSGFDILVRTTDFPIELFLLMGDDYVGNPEIGKKCHRKRMEFELSVSSELRRELYKSLAQLELGRECIIYARNKV